MIELLKVKTNGVDVLSMIGVRQSAALGDPKLRGERFNGFLCVCRRFGALCGLAPVSVVGPRLIAILGGGRPPQPTKPYELNHLKNGELLGEITIPSQLPIS